jgi:hypothetical protein
MPVDNPSMPATSPCQTLLFALRTLIAEHRLPVSEVPRWKQSIGTCYREHQITEAEYEAAMKELGE